MTTLSRLILASLLLGLPGLIIIARVYWARHRRGYRIAEAPFAFLIPVIVFGLFLLSITNLAFNWSVGFAVGFPLLGIGLPFLGLGLALFSRLPERWGLISANCLFLMMSFCSIIAPN
jgi:hypothetical protein